MGPDTKLTHRRMFKVMASVGVFTGATPPAKEAKLYQHWFEAQAGLD